MKIIDPFNHPDLKPLRFGFYKMAYIRPTQRCPASCRHCSARSGPHSGQTARLEKLEKWVASIVSIPGIEWLFIEGGEPFLALPQLKSTLQIAHKFGVSTAVLTNAYWAINERRAQEMLKMLPRINFLIVSADEFHEEWIPVDRTIRVLKEARPYVDRLAVHSCVGPDHLAFMTRFHEQAGEELWNDIDFFEMSLAFIGRASETGIMEAPQLTNELPEGTCIFLGTPVVREDGCLVACCQENVVLNPKKMIFHLGNLDQMDASVFKSRVNSNIYFQTLRIFGPKAIAEAALKSNWGWKPRLYAKNHICDLCMDLASNQMVFEKFQEMFDTPEYKAKLALGRSLLYDEPLSFIRN